MSNVKTVKVEVDQKLMDACKPFDYNFDGTSVFNVPSFQAPRRDGSWSIGLIVGPSGSGKSTLLKDNYGITPPMAWNPQKAIASQVDYSKFMAVGLNSVPTWCRPYQVLSNGEAFRADLAAAIDSNTAFDEFTSVIDRTVAKAASHAIQRHIRLNKLTGVVFASCHYDIADWLNPDWVFDIQKGEVAQGGFFRREPIRIEIERCSHEWWGLFKNHHYLTGDMNRASRCFLARWDGKPVGFSAVLPFPNGNFKNAWREHRTVILPDFQGLGIGVRLSDAVASCFVENGFRFFSKTAHPRLAQHRNQSVNWKPTSKNGKARLDYKEGRKTKEDGHKMAHAHRVCFSHEYISHQ